MAINFYELGRKSGATTPKDQQSGFEAFVGGATKPLEDMLAASKVATAALTAAMPAGVPIDKVPEELRSKVTEYLTNNKKAYTDATKVIASGINPQSQRYKDAVEAINKVNVKFENLSNTLEDIAVKRKQALDDPTFSPATLGVDQLTFENLQNGSLYSNMTLNEDGTFNYIDGEGTSKAWSDFTVAKQGFTGQQAYVGALEKLRKYKKDTETASWSKVQGEMQITFDSLFQQLGPKGSADYAFADDNFIQTKYPDQDINDLRKNSANVVNDYKKYVMEQLEDEYGKMDSYDAGFPGTKSDQAKSIKYNQAKKEYNEFINRRRIKYSDNNTKRESVKATPQEQISQVYKSISPNVILEYIEPDSTIKDNDGNTLNKGYYHKVAISESDGKVNYEYRPLGPGPDLRFKDVDHLIDYNQRVVQ